jgi:hypothetical protein
MAEGKNSRGGLKKSLTEIGIVPAAKKARYGQRGLTMAGQLTLENNSPGISKVEPRPSPGKPPMKNSQNTQAVATAICPVSSQNQTSISMSLDEQPPTCKACKEFLIFFLVFHSFSGQQLNFFSQYSNLCLPRPQRARM